MHLFQNTGKNRFTSALLPEGIIRVAPEALASKRLITDFEKPTPENPIHIAAFDFDGTCISGSSPKKLVNTLGRHGKLSLYKLLRLGVWGIAYKMNKPRNDEAVRMRVFSAFAGIPAPIVNEQLWRFYDKKVEPMYRTDADACMFAHLEAGHAVVVVSATFEPIIAEAMTEHPIEFAIASRMKVDTNGYYTSELDGQATEGPAKLDVLEQFANDYFGKDCWVLEWAYGDHYSDLRLLESAQYPCAVTPDGKLEAVAKERGWKILQWE